MTTDFKALFFVLAAIAQLSWASLSFAQENWPRFRGENGVGASEASTIPVSWKAADYNWRIDLPGSGNSSPVVWGDKVFLQCADPKTATRYVVCVNADSGKTNWVKQYESTPHHLHARNTFASCTPAVDVDHVYVGWSTPSQTTLKALDHNGKEVWSVDLGPWVSQHGFGTSPIVYKDMLIVNNSQQAAELKPGETPGKSSVIALDRKTGKQIWKTDRGSASASYSVPLIFTDESGTDQLICCNTTEGMYSLDPQTGKENWSIKAFDKRTVSSPITANGLLFGSTGSGGGGNYVAAIRPGKAPEVVYEVRRNASYVPTPVVYKDMLFLWNDKGFLSCVDIKTGETHWLERVEAEFSGSPVRVQDRIYCIADNGDVYVVAAAKEFKLLAVNPLGEPTRSTPAVAGGRMFLRTDTHLMSIGG